MQRSLLTIPPRPVYGHLVHGLTRRADSGDLRRSALVFAPHPDDETLGCGGTIIRKREAGADVRIVFVTDGARSHAHLVHPDRLRQMRRREAVLAAASLGVPEDHLYFLNYPEGTIDDTSRLAQDAFAAMLEACKPEDIFIPYRYDVHPDHVATNAIVRAAVAAISAPAMIHEYPIWAWFHWPRLPLPIASSRRTLRLLRHSFHGGFGRRVRRDCTYSVHVGGVLDKKRSSLSKHASQMRRLDDNPAWSILSDVADGAFLECFLQDFEVFDRYDPHLEKR